MPNGPVIRILPGATALLLASCAGFVEEVPSLDPIKVAGIDSAEFRQKLVSGQVPVPESSGVALAVDPALFGGVGNALGVTIESRRGNAAIPGVGLNWSELRNIPAERRSDFLGGVDVTLMQLQSAMIIARLELAKPGLETARTETMRALETAVADLNRRRGELELVQPEGWDFAKEGFYESWLDAQSAFVRAAATRR